MRRAAAAVVAATLAGCGGGGEAPPRAMAPARAVHAVPVLVSGRDDHGLRTRARVGLLAAPDGQRVAGVADGAIAMVVATRGEWLRIRTLDRHPAAGWINDFYLRGVVHLASARGCAVRLAARAGQRAGGAHIARNTQARMLAATRRDGRMWVLVRSLDGRRRGWVAVSGLHELPQPRCTRARRAVT